MDMLGLEPSTPTTASTAGDTDAATSPFAEQKAPAAAAAFPRGGPSDPRSVDGGSPHPGAESPAGTLHGVVARAQPKKARGASATALTTKGEPRSSAAGETAASAPSRGGGQPYVPSSSGTTATTSSSESAMLGSLSKPAQHWAQTFADLTANAAAAAASTSSMPSLATLSGGSSSAAAVATSDDKDDDDGRGERGSPRSTSGAAASPSSSRVGGHSNARAAASPASGSVGVSSSSSSRGQYRDPDLFKNGATAQPALLTSSSAAADAAPASSSSSDQHNNNNNNSMMWGTEEEANPWRDEIVRTIFGDVGAIRRDFSCAIERKILLHGRLYATERFICFYSNLFGFEKKIKIPYSYITCITKEYTAVFIPNAIAVITARKEYIFRSFWDRDECYEVLKSMHDTYRGVVETGPGAHIEEGNAVGMTGVVTTFEGGGPGSGGSAGTAPAYSAASAVPAKPSPSDDRLDDRDDDDDDDREDVRDDDDDDEGDDERALEPSGVRAPRAGTRHEPPSVALSDDAAGSREAAAARVRGASRGEDALGGLERKARDAAGGKRRERDARGRDGHPAHAALPAGSTTTATTTVTTTAAQEPRVVVSQRPPLPEQRKPHNNSVSFAITPGKSQRHQQQVVQRRSSSSARAAQHARPGGGLAPQQVVVSPPTALPGSAAVESAGNLISLGSITALGALAHELTSTVLPVSINQFFEHFLADDAACSLAKFHEQQGDGEVSVTPWAEATRTEKESEHTRELRFKRRLRSPIGPSATRTTKMQRCRAFGSDRGLVMNTVVTMEDIPYRDCFTIEDRWVAEPTPDRASTRVRFEFQVVWTKATMWKRRIEASSKADLEAFYEAYVAAAHGYIERHGLAAPTDKADRERKKTAKAAARVDADEAAAQARPGVDATVAEPADVDLAPAGSPVAALRDRWAAVLASPALDAIRAFYVAVFAAYRTPWLVALFALMCITLVKQHIALEENFRVQQRLLAEIAALREDLACANVRDDGGLGLDYVK